MSYVEYRKDDFRKELIQVAAVAVAIVQDLDHGSTAMSLDFHPSHQYVLRLVAEERWRQEKKWGPQHHTPEEWLAILAEEVGEAAREIERPPYRLPSEGPPGHSAWRNMQDSLWHAETFARSFLKERFGPDPVSELSAASTGEWPHAVRDAVRPNEVILGNVDPEVTG